MRLVLCITLLWLFSGSYAEAAEHRAPGDVANRSVAHEIIDGDTLVLQSGVQVRLVGIQAPKLPLGRRGFTAWPLAEVRAPGRHELPAGLRPERRDPG